MQVEGIDMFLRRLLVHASLVASLALAVTSATAQKRYDEGASDTEIKIGNTNPYSGNASAYGTIGKTIDAYFKMINEQGGNQWPKDHLHQLRR